MTKPLTTDDRLKEEYKLIPLSKGMFTKVDIDDYEKLIKYKWYVIIAGRECSYARRSYFSKGKIHHILLHRFIMDCPKGMVIDHINHDGLDNRKCNLRICTRKENSSNRRLTQIDNTSGFKGVSKRIYPNRISYVAQVKNNGKQIIVGSFDTAELAAKAYDKKAKELFGEFANLNFNDNVLRKDVEGLKMSKTTNEFNDDSSYCEGYNDAVDKFNQKINNLLKKC